MDKELTSASSTRAYRRALEQIRSELGVPGEGYPANVANAYRIADEALNGRKATT